MPESPPTQLQDPWASFLSRGLLGPSPLVANADVAITAVRIGTELVPLVTNARGAADCSWVASLRNAYGPYARAETRFVRMGLFTRSLGLAASHLGEMMLAVGSLSGGCYLNNWLLSTNLYSSTFNGEAILAALDSLCRAAPKQPLVIRSLTPPLHGDLLAGLARAGFLLFPSRQVWLVDDPPSGDWRRHRDSCHDLKLAEATAKEWNWIPGAEFSDDDFQRAHELYQQLYRRRYPAFNPDYTPEFLRIGSATGFLELTGLRPANGGNLSGFLGMIHREGVSATPLLGYDLGAPAALGLYRRLSLQAWLVAEQRRAILHCSAGVGAFKASRGARPHIEFAAVWAHHLCPVRRASLRALSASLRRWALPYLESHRL